MLPLILSLSAILLPAHAGAMEEIVLASDQERTESERRAAFDRLVMIGATDLSTLSRVSLDITGGTRQRWVAIRAMGHVGGYGVEQTLVDLLADPEPAIRTAAVSALGDVGGSAYSIPLASSLQDPAIIVRAAAAEALGKIRDPSTITALASALSDPENYHRGTSLWVRRHYVVALGEIGDHRALPVLLGAMDDDDIEVSRATIGALERISGFTFSDGRSTAEERTAWQRWASAQIQSRGL
jgi:HEAT repeat protein